MPATAVCFFLIFKNFVLVFAFFMCVFYTTCRTVVDDVYQWISKRDVQPSSISITWELSRNVNSQASLQTYDISVGGQ